MDSLWSAMKKLSVNSVLVFGDGPDFYLTVEEMFAGPYNRTNIIVTILSKAVRNCIVKLCI